MPKNALSLSTISTKYVIKGQYDGEYEISDNQYVLDLKKGSFEKNEIYYNQKSYNGRIWVDENAIYAEQAVKIRPALADKEQDFCWGNKGAGAKIAALAICAHIF